MPDEVIVSGTKSLAKRLGLTQEPSKIKKWLRATFVFLKETGEEQLKQLPVWGPVSKGVTEALLELANEEDDEVIEQRLERLLAVGEQSLEEIAFLSATASLI
jgi:hypothetical protein